MADAAAYFKTKREPKKLKPLLSAHPQQEAAVKKRNSQGGKKTKGRSFEKLKGERWRKGLKGHVLFCCY